jgi:argininosuccinate lyase
LIDDLEMMAAAYRIVNKNPLGSGAGYGSSLPLNRTLTTELLGFSTLNYNSVYAQMTRGKTEKAVAVALATIAATISKLSMDCCLYLNQNFGFISFPEQLTTGSSIMPHKKNPDVFELVRAKGNRIQAIPNELTLLINNLPSGYHRDLQLTKEILFPAIADLKDCLGMITLMFENIEVNDHLLQDEKYKYLFSVEAVNQLVQQGVYFRDAYRQVGDAINSGSFVPPQLALQKEGWHEGSIGHLCLKEIAQEMRKVLKCFK